MRRVYPITGTFVEQVTVTDPTGRSGTSQVAVRVVRQWMRRLAVVPKRMRPSALESVPTDTEIRFATRVPGPVNFRIERGIPRRDSGALRWVHTRFHFRAISEPSDATLRPELKGLAVLASTAGSEATCCVPAATGWWRSRPARGRCACASAC